MAQTLVGLFHTAEDAHRVVEHLSEAGIPAENIGLVAPESKSGDIAAGAGAGAVVGGAAGLLLTTVAFAIPGVGPVLAAGTLAGIGTLTGAGIGVVTGSIIGALVEQGVPEGLAPHYEAGLKRGGAVVTARVTDAQIPTVKAVFQQNQAAEVEETGLTDAALRRGHEELQHIAPAGSEPLHFGASGARTQLDEDPISEIAIGRESRP